jgi:hypothetical protein
MPDPKSSSAPPPSPPSSNETSIADVFADPNRLRERMKLAFALSPPRSRRRK